MYYHLLNVRLTAAENADEEISNTIRAQNNM